MNFILSKSLSFILEDFHWKFLKWGIIESRISYIQYRILYAFKSSNFRLVRNLQRLLIFSVACRFSTVREIAYCDQHFNNNSIFLDSYQRCNFALNLRPGYFSGNLNYILVSKNKGFSFFFQETNLHMRCVQSLWNKALIPVIELNSDRNSYGFRPFRDCRDLLVNIKSFSVEKNFFSWVLKYHVSVFDLNSDWFIKHCPIEKNILKNWLKKKLLVSSSFLSSVPHFCYNVLSLTLINFLFNGLESVINEKKSLFGNKIFVNFRLIRYLNEFLVFSYSLDGLVKLNIYLKRFFKKRYFKKSGSFFSIYSFFEDFEFVYWRIKRFEDNSICISLSRNKIREYKLNLKQIIKNHNNKSLFSLVKFLNSFISSWNVNSNFCGFVDDISGELDVYLQKLLWKWARRRHPRRPNTWIYSKYWKSVSGTSMFFSVNETGGVCFLRSHVHLTPKVVYRIPCSVNYFDLRDNEKFINAWYKKFKGCFKGIIFFLWKKQKGVCFCCNRILIITSINNLKVLDTMSFGKIGNNLLSNFVLMHDYCNL